MKKGDAKEILEIVNFIKDRMLTKDDGVSKDDLAAVEKRLDERIDGLKVKVEGIQNTLDAQTLVRTDQKLPDRVSDLEVELFGSSRAPRHTTP